MSKNDDAQVNEWKVCAVQAKKFERKKKILKMYRSTFDFDNDFCKLQVIVKIGRIVKEEQTK